MSTRLNRAGYESLIAGDIGWLLNQPRTLERDHILLILQRAVAYEYGAPIREELRQRVEAALRRVPRKTPSVSSGMIGYVHGQYLERADVIVALDEALPHEVPGLIPGISGASSGYGDTDSPTMTRAGLEPATYGLKGPESIAGDTPTNAGSTGSTTDSTGDDRRSAPENGAESPEKSPDDTGGSDDEPPSLAENDGAGEAGGLLALEGRREERMCYLGVEIAPERKWRARMDAMLADPEDESPGPSYLAMALRIRELEGRTSERAV